MKTEFNKPCFAHFVFFLFFPLGECKNLQELNLSECLAISVSKQVDAFKILKLKEIVFRLYMKF